jgi:tripartite-type tricarboxylate transporter receptor subunit TctC
VVSFPFVVAVKTSHRFQTLADLITEAKAKPDTLTFSAVGVGSTQHLAGELLSSMAGIKMIHVPYKGGGGPINDLLGGRIDILIDTLTISAPQLAAGTIRGLGVTSEKPWFSIPDVPPIDAIVRGYEVDPGSASRPARTCPNPSSINSIANYAPCSKCLISKASSRPWGTRFAAVHRTTCET